MLRHDPRYRRLKVTSPGMFSSASYWLATDHLFVVEQSGYAERYHRFALDDIQALIIRGTQNHQWWLSLFGTSFLGWLIGILIIYLNQPVGVFTSGALVGAGICLGLALISLIFAVENWRRGPACACHIQTGVQVRPLPLLTRQPKAELLLRELTPLIQQVQGNATAAAPASNVGTPPP